MVVAPEAIRRGALQPFIDSNNFSSFITFYPWRFARIFSSLFIYISAVPFSALSKMSKLVTSIGPVIQKGP
jgi:hypothetical protein